MIGEWSPLRDLVAASVALSSFDFKSPHPVNVDAPTLNRQGAVLRIESYDYAGAYGFANGADGVDQARLRMEEIEASGKHLAAAHTVLKPLMPALLLGQKVAKRLLEMLNLIAKQSCLQRENQSKSRKPKK